MADDNTARQMSAALIEIGERMAQVVEATEGYRKQCEERGFSPTAAEQMALSYHHLLLARIVAGQ